MRAESSTGARFPQPTVEILGNEGDCCGGGGLRTDMNTPVALWVEPRAAVIPASDGVLNSVVASTKELTRAQRQSLGDADELFAALQLGGTEAAGKHLAYRGHQ